MNPIPVWPWKPVNAAQSDHVRQGGGNSGAVICASSGCDFWRRSGFVGEAGPRNLAKFRAFAERAGFDPNIWFNNVELGAAEIVGQETVQYVDHIYMYYIAYQLAIKRLEADKKAHQDNNNKL